MRGGWRRGGGRAAARRLVLAALGAALALGGSLAGARAAAAAPPGLGAAPVSIDVDRASTSVPRPQDFLGLALEYNTIPEWVGDASSAQQVNPVLVQLLRNLDPAGHPSIRIGGQSTDRSWWPVPGLPTPAGITYTLTPQWTVQARLLAQALSTKLILSVNLEADSTTVSGYEADQLLAGVGRENVAGMEIGNEAQLYTKTPWYRLLNGQAVLWYKQQGAPVFSRPAGYDEADFLAEFERTLKVLPPGIPIVGPDAVSARWLGPFASEFVSPGGRVRMLDSHAYALQSCVTDPYSPHYPTIPNLLAPYAAQNIVEGAERYVGVAHRAGLTFRIDEMGSVTCNGKAGVSDTMAAALWATDALFYVAQGGMDGVNLHSYPNSTNGLFDFTDGPTGWQGVVHPIYYGALMFARADPAGARLLGVQTDARQQLRVWSTIGSDHRVRVLIDNVGSAATVVVHAPRGFGSRAGSLQRLLAPGVAATSGLTLGGRAFGTTVTGRLGAPAPDMVHPGPGGYTVSVPAASEALLTLRYREKDPHHH